MPLKLFAVVTPEEVCYYVCDLVGNVGPKGLILCPKGLILCSGCDAPVYTKPENMEAFVAAAQEFGKVNSDARFISQR